MSDDKKLKEWSEDMDKTIEEGIKPNFDWFLREAFTLGEKKGKTMTVKITAKVISIMGEWMTVHHELGDTTLVMILPATKKLKAKPGDKVEITIKKVRK